MYAVTVTCVTCDVDAPEVGYGGFLGTPSLSEKREKDPEDLAFGYLYAPLRALSLRPRDLEAMHEFLEAHREHKVVAWSDTQEESQWPPELVVLLRRREKEGPGGSDLGRDPADRAPSSGGGWVFGYYVARCRTCRKDYALHEPETLRAFKEQPLDPGAVRLMVSRWGRLAPDDGWNHALRPAVDPYESSMEGLLAFLKRHRHHALEAALTPVDQ